VKRYLALFAIALALGAIGLAAGRSLRRAARPEPLPAAPAEFSLEITITRDRHITPATTSVPKDHRVKLSVVNHDVRPVTLTLMGYQDRFGVSSLAPDSAWHGEFVADRPGDDFAWQLDGAPVGRLAVTGSHLVDGHR
jgi:hypothetical protein